MRQFLPGDLLLSVVLAAGTLWAGDSADEKARGCSNATLQGDYGYLISGIRPTSPGGPLEQFVGSLVRRFDGAGGFTQIDNVHGAVSGWVPDRPGKGTYSVKEDCSGTAKLQIPGLQFEPEERFAIVDGGDGLLGASMLPAPLLATHTARRTAARPEGKKSVDEQLEELQKTLKMVALRLLGPPLANP